MASKSMLYHSNDESGRMPSLFSALLELAIASLFFLSVCISMTASAIIRFFHLSPPCFCAKPHVGVSWKRDNSERLLCDYHANKLFLLKNLILNRGYAPVHSLCEDCMLLNRSSAETDAYVNSNPDFQNKNFSCNTLIHVNNCQICLSKKQKYSSPSAFNEAITAEGSGGLQGEVGSDSGSSDSFVEDRSKQPMTYPHSRCSCCKELIREKVLSNEFVKKKFAKVFVEDLEEPFWGSSSSVSPETARMPSGETGQSEVLGEGSLINYAKEGKAHEIELEDDSRLEETVLEGKVQLQDHSLGSKSCSDMPLEKGEAVGSELPQILSERCAKAETYLVDEYTVAAPVPCVRVHPQPSDNDVIKELQDALEAEREAHSALYTELEAERNASAIAANETMAMMSRLQEEKAAAQMETRQLKRMAEEKAVFDQEAIALLKDILCKREEEKFALEKEVELYRSNHRIRMLRRQRRKRPEFEQPHDKQRVNEQRVLLLEERKDTKIIKESQELQGLSEHYRCPASSDYDLAGDCSLTERASKMSRFEDSETWETKNEIGSEFRKRHDDLLPSSIGKNLLIAFDAVGTKSGQEDPSLICGAQKSKDLYSAVNLQDASLALDEVICQQKLAVSPGISDDEGSSEQSSMMQHDAEAKQEADKVEDHAYDPWMPAYSTELQQLSKFGTENLASLSMDIMERLSQNISNLNNDDDALEGTHLEDSSTMLGPYSERDQECLANGKSITNTGDGCQESCHYNSELVEDFITIEVEPMNMNSRLKQESTETMNHQQVVDVRATPSSFVQYEIGDELFELPSDLNFSEELHQDPDSAGNIAISSSEQSLSQVDNQASERDSKDSNFCNDFPPFFLPQGRHGLHDHLQDARNEFQASDKTPQSEVSQELGIRWQRGAIREIGRDKDLLDPGNSLAGFDEWTSNDALDQDSLCSADEDLSEFSGCDIRNTSMVRRDYQRKAVDEEVEQLTLRLQFLEDDRHMMKNVVETLRSENGELRLLHDIAQQLQQSHGFETKLDNLKGVFGQREPSAVSEDLKNVSKKQQCKGEAMAGVSSSFIIDHLT